MCKNGFFNPLIDGGRHFNSKTANGTESMIEKWKMNLCMQNLIKHAKYKRNYSR